MSDEEDKILETLGRVVNRHANNLIDHEYEKPEYQRGSFSTRIATEVALGELEELLVKLLREQKP